jgi:AcrR family transcriptional regulator
MVESRIDSRKKKLGSKRAPVQERSRQRRDEILAATANLLDRVGFDGLTTTLVAKELGISVGSLYHYFPHKQAILHALGERWLEEYNAALAKLEESTRDNTDIEKWAAAAVRYVGEVYEEQRGILPLVQAMYAVPELRDLDDRHDEQVVSQLVPMFDRMKIAKSNSERERIAWLWLEMTHALFVSISEQDGARAKRSREDLKDLCFRLLEKWSV